MRWRAVVRLLSMSLFGEALVLPEFPVQPGLSGLGLSDDPLYGDVLARKFSYVNTFFDEEPRLDIRDLSDWSAAPVDFLIASDIFEHVAPPVSAAFANAKRLLKPGGLFLFTAPFALSDDTVEHFPDLHEYRLIADGGRTVLSNVRRDGTVERFDDLAFHGGPGATLEMRVFAKAALINEFRLAGFRSIEIHGEPDFKHGIYWQSPWSLPITARA